MGSGTVLGTGGLRGYGKGNAFSINDLRVLKSEKPEKLWTVTVVELKSLTSRHLIEFRHCVEESHAIVMKKFNRAIGRFDCGLSREEVVMKVNKVLMNF